MSGAPPDESPAVMLAIETSQRAGSVAVQRGDGSVDSERLQTKTRHDDDLLPAIDRLLKRHAVQRKEFDAVGVSIGPGGFTGLRIAVATAKMFAEVLGTRMVAVPSAQVAAESYEGEGPIAVALACKRERFWLTRLTLDDERRWRVDGTAAMTDAPHADLTGVQALLADQYLPDSMQRRCAAEQIAVIEPVFEATACLAVARRMLQAGEIADPMAFVPLYAREPEAVRLWAKKRRDDRAT